MYCNNWRQHFAMTRYSDKSVSLVVKMWLITVACSTWHPGGCKQYQLMVWTLAHCLILQEYRKTVNDRYYGLVFDSVPRCLKTVKCHCLTLSITLCSVCFMKYIAMEYCWHAWTWLTVCTGMLRRPKPTDSEADLLHEQEKFLASGTPSTVTVVRRPDKRRGELGGAVGDSEGPPSGQRDVITMPGLY